MNISSPAAASSASTSAPKVREVIGPIPKFSIGYTSAGSSSIIEVGASVSVLLESLLDKRVALLNLSLDTAVVVVVELSSLTKLLVTQY